LPKKVLNKLYGDMDFPEKTAKKVALKKSVDKNSTKSPAARTLTVLGAAADVGVTALQKIASTFN